MLIKHTIAKIAMQHKTTKQVHTKKKKERNKEESPMKCIAEKQVIKSN